jgi:hypothetical protein
MKAAGEFICAMVILVAIAALLGLGGCTPMPRVPDVVQVPVPIACIRPGAVPSLPAIASDAELARLDDYDLVRLLAAERAALLAWLTEIVPVLEVCARAPVIDHFRLRAL